MRFVLEMAGVAIEIHHKYDYIRSLCQDYLAADQEQYAFSVEVSDEEIQAEMEMNEHRFTEVMCETTCIHRKVVEGLSLRGIILMHSAVIAVDGKAYVFMAKSGVGKSTHIRLWMEHFGERAVVVNGDKPMFAFSEDGSLQVYGSPWRGKEKLGANISMPVAAICLLQRGETNEIVPATQGDIIRQIFHQVLLPKNKPELVEFMKLLNRIIKEIPFYRLKCNMQPEAAVVAYEGMQR